MTYPESVNLFASLKRIETSLDELNETMNALSDREAAFMALVAERSSTTNTEKGAAGNEV